METTNLDYGSRGRVGILLPSVNRAAEPQLRAMLPAGIGLATTRLKLADTSEKALLGMAKDLEVGVELLADAGVDLIVFHCTAVSTYSSELESSILARIEAASGLPALATSQALVRSLRALNAHRLVMLSPYPAHVNAKEAAYFRAHGFEVLASGGRACTKAPEMMAITPEEWIDMAVAHALPRADAYVLSCTTTRAAEAVEALERRLERPVITSNSAVAWACAWMLNAARPLAGFGALLRVAATVASEPA